MDMTGRGQAAARVRDLLRERERATTTHVRTVLDGRDRLTALRDQATRLDTQITQALHALADLGYTRAEIAALCDIPEHHLPRRRTRAGGHPAPGGHRPVTV